VGIVKLPFEKNMSDQLKERGVIPPTLSAERWNQLGQTGLAGTLGGLRSVFAVVLSLKAHSHFANQEWYELEQNFGLVTSLAPRNPYYWSTGGWHLAYNASAWARDRQDLRPIQRESMELEYLEKGDAFFREGIVHNPDNIGLWAQIGALWVSPYRRPDHQRAAEAWKEASERGNNPIYQRRYVYTLAQIRGREYEALEYARKLVKDNPYHLKFPAFRVIYWVLHTLPNLPAAIPSLSLESIFETKERAYREIYNYRFRVHEENFYAGSVDETLESLIEELDVPVKLNPFLSPRRRRMTPREWEKSAPASLHLDPQPVPPRKNTATEPTKS